MADVTSTVRVAVAVEDQATGPLKAIQNQFKGFAAPIEAAAGAIKQLGDTTGLTQLGQSLGAASKQAAGFAGSILKIAGPLAGLVGVTAGIGSLVGAVDKFSAAGERLNRTAKVTGETVERLQDLEHWASLGGVSAGELSSAAARVNKTLGEAAHGSKAAAEVFKGFGIEIKDAAGKTRTFGEIAPELAAKFAGIADASERARLGQTLFGKSWAGIVPLLAEGPEALARATKEMDEYGRISTAGAQAAERHGNAQQKLAKALDGVRMMVAEAIVPAITPLIELFTKWVTVNRQWIAQGLDRAFKRVGEALQQIDWAAWARRGEDVLRFLGGFVQLLGGADSALVQLAAVGATAKLAGLAQTFLSLGAAVKTLATLLTPALFTPWGLALTAVAAAAYLVYQNWDKIGPVVERVVEGIRGFAAPVLAAVEAIQRFGTVTAAVFGDLLAAVVGWGKQFGAAIGEAVGGAVEAARAFGQQLGAALGDVGTALRDRLSEAFSEVGGRLETAFAPLLAAARSVWDKLAAVFSSGGQAIRDALDWLRDALAPLTAMLERVLGLTERVLGGIQRVVGGVRDAISGAGEAEAAAAKAAETAATTQAAAAIKAAEDATRAAEKAALKAQRTAEKAEEAARRSGGVPGIAAPAPAAPSPAGRGPGPWLPEIATPEGGAPASGRVDVVIKAENQPLGTRVQAKAAGAGVRARSDVGYSMPQLQPAGAT